MNKIYKPNDLINSAHIWTEGGQFFSSWVSDESTSRKGTRIFEGREEITEAEFNRLKEEWGTEAQRIAAEKVSTTDKKAVEAAYFAALPETVGGFKRGHCGRAWEVEDDYGNYVLSLPKKAAHEGWPVEKLASWIDDQISEGYGD